MSALTAPPGNFKWNPRYGQASLPLEPSSPFFCRRRIARRSVRPCSSVTRSGNAVFILIRLPSETHGPAWAQDDECQRGRSLTKRVSYNSVNVRCLSPPARVLDPTRSWRLWEPAAWASCRRRGTRGWTATSPSRRRRSSFFRTVRARGHGARGAEPSECLLSLRCRVGLPGDGVCGRRSHQAGPESAKVNRLVRPDCRLGAVGGREFSGCVPLTGTMGTFQPELTPDSPGRARSRN